MLCSSPPPDPLVPSGTSGSAALVNPAEGARAFLSFSASRRDTSDIGAICRSESGKTVSMFDAACMADTRMGTSHADTSLSVFLSDTPTKVLLPLSESVVSSISDGNVVLEASARIIIATNKVNVAQSTKIGTTLTGEARPLISEVLEASSLGTPSDIACVFNGVKDATSFVTLFEPCVVTADGSRLSHSFQKLQRVSVYEGKEAEDVLQTANTAASEVRARRRFGPADNLTKPFICEPIGFGASGYNFSASVLEQRPLTLAATEALLRAGVEQELTSESFGIFLSPDTPPLTMSRFAPSVASAASTAVNAQMGYAYDGIPVATGNSSKPVTTLQHECWSTNGAADPVKRNGDCEDSSIVAISTLLGIKSASDEELREFPVCAAVKRALYAFTPGLGVVAAKQAHVNESAASASNALGSVVGHCNGIVVRNDRLIKGIETAEKHDLRAHLISSGLDEEAAVETAEKATRASSHARWKASLLDSQELASELDSHGGSDLDSAVDTFSRMDSSLRDIGEFQGVVLGIEGTAPTSSSLFEPDATKRANIASAASKKQVLLDQVDPLGLCPSLGRLDGTTDGSNNAFYTDIVEFITSPSSFLASDKEVIDVGASAFHFVFCNADPGVATRGVTCSSLMNGDFSVAPLFKLGPRANQTLATISESVAHRLKPSGPESVSASLCSRAEGCFGRLRELDTGSDNTDDEPAFSVVVPVTAPFLNSSGLNSVVDNVESLVKEGIVSKVVVSEHTLPGVMQHEQSGEDVGRVFTVSAH